MRGVLVVLMVVGCGRGGGAPQPATAESSGGSGDACEARVGVMEERLREVEERRRVESLPLEGLHLVPTAPGVPLPESSRSLRPTSFGHLLELRGEELVYDRQDRARSQPVTLQAIRRDLVAAANRAHVSEEVVFQIAAPPEQPLRSLVQVLKEVPAGVQVRLLAWAPEDRDRFAPAQDAPRWMVDLHEDMLQRRRSRVRMPEWFKGGEDILHGCDVGPFSRLPAAPTLERIRDCRCSGVHLGAFEVVMMALRGAYQRPQTWFLLAPGTGHAEPLELPEHATIADLVDRLDMLDPLELERPQAIRLR